jgi:dipeptidyl aminopeptidase/acylaminoacyl peptidase
MLMLAYIKLFILSQVQDWFIFIPHPSGMKPIMSPAEYGFGGAEDKMLTTEDGETIHYWIKKPADKDKPYIVFFHGNAGHFGDLKSMMIKNNDRGYRLKLLHDFADNGYGFIAVSLRGYGKSTGKPSEHGFAKDVSAVSELIKKQNYKTIILGESLGAFSALTLLGKLENTDHDPAGIALIAPFSTMKEKVFEIYPEFRKLDVSNRLKYKFDNQKLISESRYKGTILLLHPSKDNTSGPYHSKILLEEGKKNGLDIKLTMLENADHVTWDPHLVSKLIFDEFK